MTAITPQHMRFIQLGPDGSWAKAALNTGTVQVSYDAVPHALCLAGDWAGVVRTLMAAGQSTAQAKVALRELRDFYTLGADCLWITMADGYVWWAFADATVIWLGPSTATRGARLRRTLGPWRNTDRQGRPLKIDELSPRLTRLGTDGRTIRAVAAADDLVRRINGREAPALARARAARAAMIAAAAAMIADLRWADFEALVDLIFMAGGWRPRRGSAQPDVDRVLEALASDETAAVQVTARTDGTVLAACIARFEAAGLYDRLFFICHAPIDDLDVPESGKVQVWTRTRLAEHALRAGLYDWLMEKSE